MRNFFNLLQINLALRFWQNFTNCGINANPKPQRECIRIHFSSYDPFLIICPTTVLTIIRQFYNFSADYYLASYSSIQVANKSIYNFVWPIETVRRSWPFSQNARIFPHSTSDKLLPLGLLITLGTQLFDETLNPTLIMTLYCD